MSIKAAAAGLLIAVAAATGGYWYYSPMLSMKSMQSALEQRDADAFNQHVDYERLRESFKGQMSAMMAEQMGSSGTSGAGALGAMLGLAMVNQMVDAFIRPEVVMRLMQSGEMDSAGRDGRPKQSSGSSGPSGSKGTPDSGDDIRWEVERKGFNRVIAYRMESGETDTTRALGVVFERYGFSQWKVTELRMPAGLIQ